MGNELTTVTAGDWLLAQWGTTHTFANHSQRSARVLIAVSPAGFERYLQLLQAALAGVDPPKEALGPQPATEHVGPPIPRS